MRGNRGTKSRTAAPNDDHIKIIVHNFVPPLDRVLRSTFGT